MEFNEILKKAIRSGASDVHLKSGMQPIIRKRGKLAPLSAPLITKEELENLVKTVLSPASFQRYKSGEEVDMSLCLQGLGRFRLNIFFQMGVTRVVIRIISQKIPSLDHLNLPPVVKKISKIQRGLVLVTGATGSGKSTTLASILEQINQTRNKHILTLEDPIEYVLKDKKSLITQRELRTDFTSFKDALKASLRQDPDVIFIGEMRDAQTIEIALQAAATGHLVLSTLHTSDSAESINRILSYFSLGNQDQIRLQLASALKAIVSQRLVHGKTGERILAVEILINSQRVRAAIEESMKKNVLVKLIEESGATYSMQSFDQSLMSLLLSDQISYKEAVVQSSNPRDFAVNYSNIANQKENTHALAKKRVIQGKSHREDTLVWKDVSDLEIESVTDDVRNERGKKKKL